MKLIPKSQTISFNNSPTCSGFEFAFGDKDINAAVVTVDGRYPEKGLLVNEVCKEIAYVLSGNGSVGVGDMVVKLSPGDAVLINPGEKFYWEGNKLEMLMPCTPAFYPEQHKELIN
ncbi:MAG TPA: cupin domain-containing protein [Candidatus Saccharimonadales bacterium]